MARFPFMVGTALVAMVVGVVRRKSLRIRVGNRIELYRQALKGRVTRVENV